MSDNKEPRACCCVGPQNGEPECPCRMRDLGIFKRGGRWIRPAQLEEDLGPDYGAGLDGHWPS